MRRVAAISRRLIVVCAAVIVVAGLLLAVTLAPKPSGQTVVSTTTEATTTETSSPETFYVEISCGPVTVCTNGFYPRNLTIPAGSQVTWYSEEPPEDYIYHRIVFEVGGIESGQLNGGDQFTATFSSPGVYPYYDADFAGNGGFIIVVPRQ